MSILNDQNCSPSNSDDLSAGQDGDSVAPAAAESQAEPGTGRRLRLKIRAERMEETRQRIARAAYELHASVGPARTSVSAIAERAGVQRLTVYKHFPHDRDILQACTSYSWVHDPLPDPEAWRAIPDPEERLRQALAEVYAYYRRNESLVANVERDLPQVLEQLGGAPPPAMQAILDLPPRWLATLAECWPDDPAAPIRRAALGLALEFGSWRALVRSQHLDDVQAVALMVALVRCAVGVTTESVRTH